MVRERAAGICEYCRLPDLFSSSPFVCEHILPRVKGESDDPSMLAWACPSCNNHKYTKTHARDPRTGKLVPLFNPRCQQWSKHSRWSDDSLSIIGLTATGRATVEELNLNRIQLINLRRALIAIGEHP
jgi:hypothetical protein